jgi:hypothetical protein
LKELPLPAGWDKRLPFRSLLSKDIKAPKLRQYYILSWGINFIDAVPRGAQERHLGPFEVGADMRWGGARSKTGLDPGLRRFVRRLELLGARPDRHPRLGPVPYDRHFYFDISTRSKPAFYHISTWLGRRLSVMLITSSLLNRRTKLPDKELIRNVEIIDWFMFAVLMSCRVPRIM